MNTNELDRRALRLKPLAERVNRVVIARDAIAPDAPPAPLPAETERTLAETVARIRQARQTGRPVILAFGAHVIKNGLGLVLIRLIEEGWVTHLATNGAGIIHDWEFAFQGASSEDVRANMARGEFGLWEETGFHINLALLVGAYRGFGYGESVGTLIEHEGLDIPASAELTDAIRRETSGDPTRAAAAADLLAAIRAFGLAPGQLAVPHPHKRFSVQAAACRLKTPFTGHPMFGQDIIYTHPLNSGAAVGRTAQRDFLVFAKAVSELQDGVYLSVGSAVMSPMIFEKAFAMGQNLQCRRRAPIDRHFIVVVDLAPAGWDWQRQGEPPPEHPAYYLRFCKTFSRVGGTLRYVSADNRDFLPALYRGLRQASG
jgi:hypothetical protein